MVFCLFMRGDMAISNCRPFQSGDRWRDLDWKDSCMLGELIVKEFAGAQGQVEIIVADLTAKNAEYADHLFCSEPI